MTVAFLLQATFKICTLTDLVLRLPSNTNIILTCNLLRHATIALRTLEDRTAILYSIKI